MVRPVRTKLIGGRENAQRGTPAVEIGVISDVIALALAQLVRDRWVAEQHGIDDGQGRLRVMVTSPSR